MNEFIVHWGASKNELGEIKETVEAKNPNNAFKIAVEKWQHPEHPLICIYTELRYNPTWYNNPHYVGLKVRDGEHGMKRRSQQPTRSDSSIRWFERIEGASLTQNEILLAQLAELRIIKSCVVGTVVLVIVIPLIVGGIISG